MSIYIYIYIYIYIEKNQLKNLLTEYEIPRCRLSKRINPLALKKKLVLAFEIVFFFQVYSI